MYNYDPLRHKNFETNPAFLATDYDNSSITAIHQRANLKPELFSYSSIKVSKYVRNAFAGIGFSINHTRYSKFSSYQHAALGGAYRTVLFDKIYLKGGLIYKVIASKTSTGRFDAYSYDAAEIGIRPKTQGNFNYSFAISSPSDFIYISFGILNDPVFKSNNDPSTYPKYRFINIGNLGKFIRERTQDDITYSAFIKNHRTASRELTSHYLTWTTTFGISRNSRIRYGFRSGIRDEEYLEIMPLAAYYIVVRKTRREKHHFLLSFSMRFHLDKDNLKRQTAPISQISFIYKTGS